MPPSTKATPPAALRSSWIAYAVLCGSLLVTLLAAMAIWRSIAAKDQLRFGHAVDDVEDIIRARMHGHVTLLRGGAGLFASAGGVDRRQFAAFVAALNLERDYPGLQGFGYTQRIPAAEKDAVTAAMRREHPRFEIWPADPRTEYHSIVYLEPLDRRNQAAIGYDMFTDEARRATMQRARDTGEPAASGKVRLVQEIDEHAQAGFLIYAPVYASGRVPATVEERRAALRGFVYSPFRADNLLRGIFAGHRPIVRIEVFDGDGDSPAQLMHVSGSPAAGTTLVEQRRIEVAGRPWTIRYTPTAGFALTSASSYTPFAILAGVAVSLMLFALTRQAERSAARLALSQEAGRRAGELAERGAEQLALVIDAVPALISYVDAAETHRFVNAAYLEWFGRPDGAVVGRPVAEVLGPAVYESVRPHIRAALAGRRVSFEEELPCADGTTRHMATTFIPDGGPAGVHGFVILASDISEHKAAEDALRSSEALFRTMADQAPVMIWMADEQNRGTYFNQPWLKFTGRRLEQELGYGWAEVVHPEDRERCYNYCQQHFDARVPFTMEFRMRHASGEYRWVLDNGVPLHSADGTFTGYIGSCLDIHDRRRSEEAARFLAGVGQDLSATLDLQATLERVVNHSVPALADGAIVHLLERDGEIRRIASTHVSADKRRRLDRVVRDVALARDAPHGYPYVIRTGRTELLTMVDEAVLAATVPDPAHRGLLRSLEIHAHLCVPLIVGGRAIGSITLFQNSPARTFSPEDVSLAEELARRAAMAVENARFYHEAQEANRLKDEFLSTLSHELRTPLNAIVGWAHFLRSGELDEAASRRAMDTILRNATVQTQLISDILDMQRITSGKLRLSLRPIAVVPLLDAALDTVRPAAQAKGIEIVTRLDPQSGHVSGDADRLQQVVWNLLSNAVKFTPRDGRVMLTAGAVDSSVEVTVEDSGPGIDPGFLPYAFDRFRQADSSSTRRHGGLGLGLSIVRSLVELHGGTVAAANRPEGGARFTVRLPSLRDGSNSAVVGDQEGADPLPALHGVRVLVVDDEPDAREVISAALARCGADVSSAASADEAMIVLRERRPDVLLSDIEMPGEDGYSLLRRVRALPRDGGGLTPAAALTAYAGAEDRVRSLAAGFQVHVAKPVRPQVLAGVVAGLVGRGPSASPPL